MKVMLDTNVVLDLLFEREQFADDARAIFELVESRKISGYLCATAVTTIYYLVAKTLDKPSADDVISKLLRLFDIAEVDKKVLLQALLIGDKDYEDSVVYSSAEFAKIDKIITRDKNGFAKSKVVAISPKEFLGKF